jgi:crotonobetainyl-CoA:carnitine CoA-transferase CaiB-like acyl-CoA transferase
LRFSQTPVSYEVPPPLLGQHTQQVLQDVLGMDPAQVKSLRDKGVV